MRDNSTVQCQRFGLAHSDLVAVRRRRHSWKCKHKQLPDSRVLGLFQAVSVDSQVPVPGEIVVVRGMF